MSEVNRVKCSSIRSNEYYRIPNETVLRNLVDENRSTNGLEVYYVRGHNDTTPDMSEMVAINIEGRGIVITKFGNLDKNETESMYSANVLAHEILHSARWKDIHLHQKQFMIFIQCQMKKTKQLVKMI